eukprot:4058132-Pyramimonas_sp.AAC.1
MILPSSGSLGTALEALLGCFEASSELFGGPLRGLGSVGGLWGVLESSRRSLAASCSRSWAHLGP